MEYRKIIAIISADSLAAVEDALKREATIQVAITRIKGYGDYKNFYDPDWVSTRARVEVFAAQADIPGIAEAIMDAAHAGLDNDGVVAVIPVEEIYRIRDHRSHVSP